MNRRNFAGVAFAMTALMAAVTARAAEPCPPPVVAVSGGTTASTTCPTVALNSYSTTFSTKENPLSQGGMWVNGKANGLKWNNVQSNGAGAFAAGFPTSGHYDDSIAHLAGTFNSNQFAQGTVSRAAGYSTGHEIELLVRFSITANSAKGYEVYWSTNGGIYIVRWNGPLDSFSPLAVADGYYAVDGDTMRVEAVGTTITVFVNGRAILSTTDSSYSNGSPGMGFMPWGDNAVLTNYGWKSFQGGNL